MELRPYQSECIESVWRSWEEYQKLLIVLATGTGKTVIMSKIIEQTEGRVLFLVHNTLLLQQFVVKLGMITGLSSKCLVAGQWNDTESRVHAALLDSATQDRLLDHYDYIFIDEAHRAMSDGYMELLSWFPSAMVLGVTATPDRSDKKQLGEYFEYIAYEYLLDQAIKDGWACPIKVKQIPLEDLDE